MSDQTLTILKDAQLPEAENYQADEYPRFGKSICYDAVGTKRVWTESNH